MAANSKSLTRIYDLRVLGGDTVIKSIKNINTALAENAKLKALASKNVNSAADLAEIEKYRQKVKELTVEELKLKAAQKEALNEKKLLATASVEAANNTKKEQQNLVALEGSYKAIVNQMKILRPLIQNANAGSTISFGGQNINFSQAIAEFKKLSAAEQDFRRQFAKDGTLVGEYTTGIIQAFQSSGLDKLITAQLQGAKKELRSLDENFDLLKKELSQVGVTGQGNLQKIEKELIENRNEANRLRASIAGIETEISKTAGTGNMLSKDLAKGFSDVRNTIGGVVAGYIGFQAAVSKGTQLIGDAKTISDSITEIEVNLGLATGGSDKFVASLQKINTRTTLQGLLDIADVALKAGVSSENLAGVTEAIDKVKVAFGKDFGSIETGTETFAKLIAIFFDDGQITGDRILNIGNSIRSLANETTASVPFLTDFAGRMAGVKQIANVSLPDILGLGAGFEEFKQSAEVSSTALVKIIPKLATDTEKYAAILGITQEKYKELIDNDPTKVLIDIAEKLVKSGSGITDVSAALADSELGSGRITTILTTLGGKADIFRERIARASDTIQTSGAITDAFTAKNTNLAGTLDKVSKKITDAANNQGFKDFLVVVGGLLAGIIGLPFPYLIGLMTIILGLTNATFGAKLRLISALVLEKTAQFALASIIVISNGYYATRNGILTAYNIIIIRSATASGIAAVAYRLLAASVAFLTSPLGIVVGLVVAFTTVVGIMSSKAAEGTSGIRSLGLSWRELAAQQRINVELSQRVSDATSSIASRVRTLTTIVSDLGVSEKVRRDAMNQLIALSPKYREALNGEQIDIDKVRKASDELILSLQKQARVKAIGDLTAEKEKRAFELESKIAGSFTEQTDAAGNVIGREVRNKDNSLFGAVKSLFVDNEVATLDKDREELARVQDDLKQIYKLAAENKELQESIVAVDPVETPGSGGGGGNKKNDKVAKIKEQSKSATEALKAAYELEKKELEAQFNDKKIDEETFNVSLLNLATDYRSKKLTSIKAANEEERKEQVSFNSELSKDQVEANKKLFEINEELLEQQLQNSLRRAQTTLNTIEDDPNTTSSQRLRAKLNFLAAELNAQRTFDESMIALETKFGVDSVAAAAKRRDDLAEIERQIRKTAYDLAVASYQEQLELGEDASTRQQNETQTNTAQRTINVLNDPSLSTRRKALELRRIELEETKLLLAQEVAAAKIALEQKEKALLAGLETEEEVSEARKKLKLAELALLKFTTDNEESLIKRLTSGLKNAFDNITGFFRGMKATQEEIQGAIQAAGSIVQDALQTAKTAYFDNQRQQADDAKTAAIERLNLEQQQLEFTAQSEEEKETIRRRFDEKRKQAEKQAGEEKRQIALKEIAINFAVAVVKTLATYPFPFSLIPVAGLAIAYALQRSAIQKQKFKQGGMVPTSTGGDIDGPSHSDGGVPFNYEAEGGELAIVNKKSAAINKQITATGTPRQILSMINQLGGGISFANGGRLQKLEYGGLLGDSLKAPRDLSFINNTSTAADSGKIYETIMAQQNMIVAQSFAISDMNKKISTLKVQVVAREVERENDQQTITADVGTLG